MAYDRRQLRDRQSRDSPDRSVTVFRRRGHDVVELGGPETRRSPDQLIAALADELSDATDGIAFIYRALDRIALEFGASDVVVVLDEPPLGRQLFRVGGRELSNSWAEGLILHAPVGVHVPGKQGVPPATNDRVTRLCQLALRFDAARYDAQHDALTGLFNRRVFNDLLQAACARTERDSSPFSLVLLDVDGFKAINDRLGHAAGDHILRTLSAELHHRVRAGDIAARIGGDEFALVLVNAQAAHIDDLVAQLVQRVESAVRNALLDVDMTLSAGVATAPADSTDPVTLTELADSRLYAAKNNR